MTSQNLDILWKVHVTTMRLHCMKKMKRLVVDLLEKFELNFFLCQKRR